MKNIIFLTLLVAAALVFSGCAEEQSGMDMKPGTAATSPPDMSEPPAKPSKETPSDGTDGKPRMKPLGGSESTVVTRKLPAGEKGGTVYLEKSAPKQVLVGKEFDYKIRLTNMSDSTLEDVRLVGKLPRDFQLVSTEPKASIDGRDAVWDVGKMAPDESKLFVIRGAATKTGSLYGCSDVMFRISSACVAIKAVKPALKVSQTAPEMVLICQPIPITVVVTNTGTGPAGNVIVRETLPEGLTTTDGKSEVAYDFKTIAPGQAKKITIKTKADKTGAFVARAKATGADDITASDDSETIVREPILELTHEAPKKRFLGLKVNNTITVANKGDGVARGTRLVTALPEGCEVVRASEGVKPKAGELVWKLGDIAPGKSQKVTYVIKPASVGKIRSVSSASALCAEASTRAFTDIEGIPAILLECVDEADPIEVGSKEIYTITVTNQGTAADTNVVVECTLPQEQEFVSAKGPTRDTVKERTVSFAPLKSLAPKAKATYKVVVKAINAGDVRFSVSLTSDQLKTPVRETESTNQYAE